MEGGKQLAGWQKLDWEKGNDWFYFDKETGKKLYGWQKIDDNIFYLDKNYGNRLTGFQKLNWEKGNDWFYFHQSGIMLTGWQKLDWEKGNDWFYFYITGVRAENGCFQIEGKQYSFNENGCLINN